MTILQDDRQLRFYLIQTALICGGSPRSHSSTEIRRHLRAARHGVGASAPEMLGRAGALVRRPSDGEFGFAERAGASPTLCSSQKLMEAPKDFLLQGPGVSATGGYSCHK